MFFELIKTFSFEMGEAAGLDGVSQVGRDPLLEEDLFNGLLVGEKDLLNNFGDSSLS